MYPSSTSTTKKMNKIKCWYCHKYFYAGRSLTNHLNACSKKKSAFSLPCSNVQVRQTISGGQENQTLGLQESDQENEREQNQQEQNDDDLQADYGVNFADIKYDDSEDSEKIALVEKQRKYHDDTKEVE